MGDPAIPQKAPYVQDMAVGDYFWCACGHSKKQPFCDGSHKTSGTGLTPIKATCDIDKRVAWCGCKHSGMKPYCDGSHKKLP